MKKTSSALALAIAGTMAAPAVMAESGYYMSARLGVDMKTNDVPTRTTEYTKFGDMSTRMGWRMETDLGNGMAAYGKFEVSAGFATRDLFVGLKGDFGDIKVAQAGYAAFYNHVTGPVDQPYFVGGGGIIGEGTGRTARHISYQGGTDAFSFEVTAEADGTDRTNATEDQTNTGLSGVQVGATIALGDWSIGLAMRDTEDALDADTRTAGSLTGIGVSGNIGDISLAFSFMSDDNDDGTQIHAGFGPFFINYGMIDEGLTNRTPTTLAAGYARSIGRNTTWWIEGESNDADGGNDSTRISTALRYDWK